MKQTIKLQSTILITSLLCLVACSQDGGKKDVVNRSMDLKQAQDVSSNLTNFQSYGNYEDLVKEGKEKSTDRYSLGCKEDQGTLDPATKVGDRVLKRVLSSGQTGSSEQLKSSTVLTIAENRTETLEEISSISVSGLGEILEKKIVYNQACEKKIEKAADGKSESVNVTCKPSDELTDDFFMSHLTPAARSYYTDNKNSMESCHIEKADIADVNQVEVGDYTLPSGNIVKAYKTTYIKKGPVVCVKGSLKQMMGAGTETQISIQSNQVLPGSDSYFCGGATIVRGSTLQVDDLIVDSYREENLNPSVRE